jgi:hypothetical protein
VQTDFGDRSCKLFVVEQPTTMNLKPENASCLLLFRAKTYPLQQTNNNKQTTNKQTNNNKQTTNKQNKQQTNKTNNNKQTQQTQKKKKIKPSATTVGLEPTQEDPNA